MNEQLQPLLSFKEQFAFEPILKNSANFVAHKKTLVCGMGGSAIAVNFLNLLFPDLSLSLHNSYNIPKEIASDTLVIINSYSGDTEEELDSFTKAITLGFTTVAVSKGGKLLELAKANGSPYVELPESGLEPRFATGHQMIAILTIIQREDKKKLLKSASEKIGLESGVQAGSVLASRLANKYPVIYSSPLLNPLTYPIKAAINEGAKLPAFVNVIPEANHNELQGFVVDESHNESNSFGLLFFVSSFDHPRIQKRMTVMRELYGAQGFVCEEILVDHSSPSSLLDALFLGYSFATALAINRGVNPYTTPFIQEFKKKMAD